MAAKKIDFPKLSAKDFDLFYTYHADAILTLHFPKAIKELDEIVSSVTIPIAEIIAGGGGDDRVEEGKLHRFFSRRNFRVERPHPGPHAKCH